MSLAETTFEIEYPESDGEPMGETDLHIHWMIRIRDILKHRYQDQRVYVASDLLLYYVEGVPRKFVSPDVFVVLDCDPNFRRTFKVWEEGRVPNVAMEVTCKGTRYEDEIDKPRRYTEIGVREYFLYDPTADYLRPPLRGLRLKDEEFEPIEANTRGQLECLELGVTLELDGSELVMRDMTSGVILPTPLEASEAARAEERAAAQAAQDAERAARTQAEARAAELEEEVRRLRESLDSK